MSLNAFRIPNKYITNLSLYIVCYSFLILLIVACDFIYDYC